MITYGLIWIHVLVAYELTEGETNTANDERNIIEEIKKIYGQNEI